VNAAERIRRGRSVRKHVIAALLIMLLLIPVNFVTSPKYPWWMWVMLGWLPVMAAHTAWAMGMFDRRGKRED
jgi:hypothetical protein